MDMKSILTKSIIFGLLILSIMSFIIIIQSDAGLEQENRILNNSIINESFGNLQTSLNQQQKAQSSLDSLEDIPPQEYVGDLDVSSVVSATKVARGAIIGLWNIYIKGPQIILGVSPIVAASITSLILIFIAIAIWAVWKGAIS